MSIEQHSTVFSTHDKAYDNFYDAYRDIIKNVLDAPEVTVRNEKTRELLGYSFSIRDTTKIFDLQEQKRIDYLLSEILWYAAGSFDSSFIEKYSKFWIHLKNRNGTVNSNYGERIFRQKAVAPFFKAYYQLLKDPNSRQAIVHINLPEDINEESRDIPCTLTLQFFIRNNAVHMLTSMRSNDVWRGLTYDVPNFYVFLHTMQLFLKNTYPDIELGEYRHISGSMHIYERNYADAEKFLEQSHELIKFRLNTPLVLMTGQPVQELKNAVNLIENNGRSAYDLNNFYQTYFV